MTTTPTPWALELADAWYAAAMKQGTNGLSKFMAEQAIASVIPQLERALKESHALTLDAAKAEGIREAVKMLRERAKQGRIWQITAWDMAVDYLERSALLPPGDKT